MSIVNNSHALISGVVPAAAHGMASMLHALRAPASQTRTPVVITLANPWAGIES